MKKALRQAYKNANLDPAADIYMTRTFWDAAQNHRESLRKTYGIEITEEMAAIGTIADYEKRNIAFRIDEPDGPIVIYVPGKNGGHLLKSHFRELVSVKRRELKHGDRGEYSKGSRSS